MWIISYHPSVEKDLELLGKAAARRILRAIDERIINGEPDKIGKALTHKLAGFRRIRVGDTRIVYKVFQQKVTIIIMAVGPRRDNEIYEVAYMRSLEKPLLH